MLEYLILLGIWSPPPSPEFGETPDIQSGWRVPRGQTGIRNILTWLKQSMGDHFSFKDDDATEIIVTLLDCDHANCVGGRLELTRSGEKMLKEHPLHVFFMKEMKNYTEKSGPSK